MIEDFLSMDFINVLFLKFDFLIKWVNSYLSTSNNLKIISFFLIFLALILFLSLILIIYIRNIVYFVKSNNPRKNLEENNDASNEERYSIFTQEEQQELERELQKDCRR